MVTRHVIIETSSDSDGISTELLKIPQIKDLRSFPPGAKYNFIAKIEINGEDEFQKIREVLEKIRKIEGIINSWTIKGVTRGLEDCKII